MEDPEFIAICVDNSTEAYVRGNFEPQLNALKHYCKAKLKANSETKVVFWTMGIEQVWPALSPTNDYQTIQEFLPRIKPHAGRLAFYRSIFHGQSDFDMCPPNMQKRMLFLVGSIVDLDGEDAVEAGLELKSLGIAVDVVNFYLEGRLKFTRMISNQFGGDELAAFVDAANSNDNSHIEHVKPEDSILEVLSRSILRKTLGHSRKKDHHEKATHAAGDSEHVPSEGVTLGKRKAASAF